MHGSDRAKSIVKENMSRAKSWTKKEINIMKVMYPFEPRDKILNAINRTWKSIKIKAAKLGIKRCVNYRMPAGTNHYFFDKWSNDMAYVLGFVSADGNIKDNNYLRIGLASCDRKHLENILALVAPKKKIIDVAGTTFYKGKISSHSASVLCVGSQYMCKTLNRLGIYSNKSLTLEFPFVPKEYLSHFVRGFFDGDGCISKYHPKDFKPGINQWQTIFVGTEIFLDKLSEILHSGLGVSNKKPKKERYIQLFRLSYSTHDSIKICKWLYRDSTIHLDRKYKKFQQLIEERVNR